MSRIQNIQSKKLSIIRRNDFFSSPAHNETQRWFNFVADSVVTVLFEKKMWIIIIFQTINHFQRYFIDHFSFALPARAALVIVTFNEKKESQVKMKWLSSAFGFFTTN